MRSERSGPCTAAWLALPRQLLESSEMSKTYPQKKQENRKVALQATQGGSAVREGHPAKRFCLPAGQDTRLPAQAPYQGLQDGFQRQVVARGVQQQASVREAGRVHNFCLVDVVLRRGEKEEVSRAPGNAAISRRKSGSASSPGPAGRAVCELARRSCRAVPAQEAAHAAPKHSFPPGDEARTRPLHEPATHSPCRSHLSQQAG